MPSTIDLDEAREKAQEEDKRGPKEAPKPRARKATTRAKIGEYDAEGRKVRSTTDRKLLANLTMMYQGVGVGVGAIGSAMARDAEHPKGARAPDQGIQATGTAIVGSAGAAAEAWLDYADENPKVKVALAKLMEASAVGSLVAVHAMMLMPLLVDRGVIPPQVAAMAVMAQQQAEQEAQAA